MSTLLNSVVPLDEAERRARARMQSLAQELAEPLSRHQPRAHFTGSALVVTSDGQQVCLIHHAKSGGWFQPGGHAEPGDQGSILATALREAEEETGLTLRFHSDAPRPLHLDIGEIPAHGGEPPHEHLDVRFLLVAEDPAALRHDPTELHGAMWLTIDRAFQQTRDASFHRLLRKAKALGFVKSSKRPF